MGPLKPPFLSTICLPLKPGFAYQMLARLLSTCPIKLVFLTSVRIIPFLLVLMFLISIYIFLYSFSFLFFYYYPLYIPYIYFLYYYSLYYTISFLVPGGLFIIIIIIVILVLIFVYFCVPGSGFKNPYILS